MSLILIGYLDPRLLKGYCWSIHEWLNPSPQNPLSYVASASECNSKANSPSALKRT
jgi:hypothetical protein